MSTDAPSPAGPPAAPLSIRYAPGAAPMNVCIAIGEQPVIVTREVALQIAAKIGSFAIGDARADEIALWELLP